MYFLPFPLVAQYEITICFMNRSLLFSNDDWIVSNITFPQLLFINMVIYYC